jgi:O-antigen ligase
VLSYSRGALTALAAALLALAWLNRGRFQSGRLLVTLAAGVALGGWLIWRVFPAFADLYWFRLSASVQYFFSSMEGVLSGRLASWRTLAAWISEHPWALLTGIGYKTLPYTEFLGAPIVADNMYLSLLVETGVVGLAALVWLHAAVLRAAHRASHSDDAQRAFLGTWMFCFWIGECLQMLTGDLLTYWRVLPVYFFVLALAVRR